MTLIINDIYIKEAQDECYIVACADRRLTYKDQPNRKRRYTSGKKLFKIEYLNATVSYWGNARTYRELLSSWLPNFIRINNKCGNLKEFAEKLRDDLNANMHSDDLRAWASGFHLSGFDRLNIPEFFHFSNCKWNSSLLKYENIEHKFGNVAADFLGRDFPNEFGWDRVHWNSITKIGHQTYRNGDFKVHESAWNKLDQVMSSVFSDNNFMRKPDKNDLTIEKYYRFRLNFIGSIYQNWGNVKNVGGPFDIIILRPQKITQ